MATEAADELRVKKQLTSCKTEESWKTQHSAGRAPGRPSGNKKRCQDSHGKRSRGVMTLATNTRPVTLGTMVQVSTWTSESLVESHHTTKEV